jgi:hypothetical protein
MKYLKLGPQGGILKVLDEEPTVGEFVSVSNVKGTQIENSDERLFYIDGEILSVKDKMYKQMFEKNEEAARARKIQELKQARWDAEVGGTTWNGYPVLTDKETQDELGKAVGIFNLDPNKTIEWEFPNGTIVTLDKASVEN